MTYLKSTFRKNMYYVNLEICCERHQNLHVFSLTPFDNSFLYKTCTHLFAADEEWLWKIRTYACFSLKRGHVFRPNPNPLNRGANETWCVAKVPIFHSCGMIMKSLLTFTSRYTYKFRKSHHWICYTSFRKVHVCDIFDIHRFALCSDQLRARGGFWHSEFTCCYFKWSTVGSEVTTWIICDLEFVISKNVWPRFAHLPLRPSLLPGLFVHQISLCASNK